MLAKTNELTGDALNWAVATCEGMFAEPWLWGDEQEVLMHYKFSTEWAQGGPIIEREGLGMWMYSWNEQGEPEVGWIVEDKHGSNMQTGPTTLIAAMRCYVFSKLGEEIEIPTELKGT